MSVAIGVSYLRAQDSANTSAAYWINAGVEKAHAGQLPQAIECYRKALDIDPKAAAAQMDLAIAYYKLNRWDDARKILQPYHSGHSDDLKSGLLLADCDLQLGRYKDSIAVAEPLEKRHASDLGLAYVLGTAYLRDKQEARGTALIGQVMGAGDSPEAHLMLGDSYMLGEKYHEAAREYEHAIETKPGLSGAHLRLAQAQISLGDFDRALPNLQAEYAVNTDNFEVNFYLGYLLKDRGKAAEAKPYLAKAAALRPDVFQARFEYAVALSTTGEERRALSALEGLAREYPSKTEVHVVLGRLYLRLRMKDASAREQEIVAGQQAAANRVARH